MKDLGDRDGWVIHFILSESSVANATWPIPWAIYIVIGELASAIITISTRLRSGAEASGFSSLSDAIKSEFL